LREISPAVGGSNLTLGTTTESMTFSPHALSQNIGLALNAQIYSTFRSITALPSSIAPAPSPVERGHRHADRTLPISPNASPCLPPSPHSARMFPSNTRFPTAFPRIHPKPTESPIHIFLSVHPPNPRHGERRSRSTVTS